MNIEHPDVHRVTDDRVAHYLQFIQEIGFGNWGSVWLAHPRHAHHQAVGMPVAVKLVIRDQTPENAARLRSLWREMKIVSAFKDDPHPSIVPFHSFIMTPLRAMITMPYLPRLVPVEVPEPKAKNWFRSLLSGIHFLHVRGVVHNDIKPANILLSPEGVPVLVDFGFAEKTQRNKLNPFQSNLTYGTPEYLSPERARGIAHDTRKSDVWSLGVTFFEILVGRTPFELAEGESLETQEDLEKYWERTMRGEWVGTWSFSKSVEKLLRRMIMPNADLRCNTEQATRDVYW
ncbi:kinase-like protein, partial [Coniophora puteana RWD-64-598 SS2]